MERCPYCGMEFLREHIERHKEYCFMKPHSIVLAPGVVVDAEFEKMKAEKRKEWEAKGYPPKLIDRAFTWAEEWVVGVATKIAPLNMEFRKEVVKRMYPEALKIAEDWMSSIIKAMFAS